MLLTLDIVNFIYFLTLYIVNLRYCFLIYISYMMREQWCKKIVILGIPCSTQCRPNIYVWFGKYIYQSIYINKKISVSTIADQTYTIVLDVCRSCYLNQMFCKFWIYFSNILVGSWSAKHIPIKINIDDIFLD